MRCAVVLAAALASACSPIFIKKAPPEPEPLRWPQCTEHRLYPLIDGTNTVLWSMATYTFLTSEDDLARVGLILSIPMLLASGVSTFYGLNETEHCQRARAAYEAAALQGR